jgi:hypothetical protein
MLYAVWPSVATGHVQFSIEGYPETKPTGIPEPLLPSLAALSDFAIRPEERT